jgi:hypothetical protein
MADGMDGANGKGTVFEIDTASPDTTLHGARLVQYRAVFQSRRRWRIAPF